MTSDTAPAECQRFLSFKQGLNDGVSRGVLGIDYEDFKTLFDGFTDAQHLGLFDLYRQVVRQICTHSLTSIDELARELDLNGAFSSLEALEKEHHALEARLREPSIQPEAAARNCRVRAKEAEVQTLQKLLQQAEEERSTAEAEIQQQSEFLEQAVAAYSAIPEAMEEVHRVSEAWAARGAVA